jgi:hypothetical protein
MSDFSRRDVVLTAAAAAALATPGCTRSSIPPQFAALHRSIEDEVGRLASAPQATVGRVQGLLAQAAQAGAFQEWTDHQPATAEKVTLVSGGQPWRKWKVQLFLIPAGASHPPHCHENLASCLVMVDGRLRVREYRRLREHDARDSVMLARAFDGELGPGQAIATTEDYRNAHWFGATADPVLAVNFKASGYARPELLRMANRRYLDPTGSRAEVFRAPFIDGDLARHRFARRPL